MPQLNTFRLYLLGIALLFVGYVTLEYNRPKPLNWSPTYVNKDKIPYGTYVLYYQLPNLLGTDAIETVRLPAYNQITGLTAPRSTSGSFHDAEKTLSDEERAAQARALPVRPGAANYLFVDESFTLSPPDTRALLAFVAQGNDVFITATEFRGAWALLQDSLGVRLKTRDLVTRKGRKGLPVVDSVNLRFTNPALAKAGIRLPGSAVSLYLAADSGRVGSTLATTTAGQPVFVRLKHGRGHFYVCTAPLAFTNYYFLKPRATAFATAALSYLPTRRTWWDEYQKQGPLGQRSLLQVVFAHDALRLAYYLLLAGGLLFVLTAARRRQRVIPTIKPLPNNTLLFTRTVASLYRHGSSHGLIAEKKVSLFMDYLRTRFQEANPDFADEAFRERLSQKSGMPRVRVDELLRMVNFARTAPNVTDQQLLILSKALNDFKREVSR